MNIEAVASQIKAARKAAGLTQAQLAEKIGTKKEGVSRIESGRHTITLEVLQKIAQALGKKLPESWLVD